MKLNVSGIITYAFNRREDGDVPVGGCLIWVTQVRAPVVMNAFSIKLMCRTIEIFLFTWALCVWGEICRGEHEKTNE